MYRDFEDLKARCPVTLRADVAIDLQHDDPAALADIWPATTDGAFRLYLVQRVSDFWEARIRDTGGAKVPDDGLAVEIEVDSYADGDMGHTLLLDLRIYCGTAAVGEAAWRILDDDELEARFGRELPGQVIDLLGEHVATAGLRVTAQVYEIEEM